MRENIFKFLNASDTEECGLSIEKRCEMFLDIVSFSFDDLLHLFFEAGMQSGIMFALDLKFIGKSELSNENIKEKIIENKSIIRELLQTEIN